MSSVIPQFRRPGVGTSLGNHEARIRALERAQSGGGGGDYVFLQETILDAPANPISLDSIDQGYQHLVLELLLQADPDSPFTGAYLDVNEFFGVDWQQIGSDTSGVLQSGTTDDAGVLVDNLVPVPPSTDVLFAMVTAKFPWYTQTPLVKGCYWQGVSINDGDENVIHAVGGGMFVYHLDSSEAFSDPVTSIQIVPSGVGSFATGSIAQLYGIKKH